MTEIDDISEEATSKHQSKAWIWTLNNYTSSQITQVQELGKNPLVAFIGYGKETAPTTGTPHLQGCLWMKKKTRFNTVKDLFLPATHFKKANGNPKAWNYCYKEYKAALEAAISAENVWSMGTLPLAHAGPAKTKVKYAEAMEDAKNGNFDDIPADLMVRHYDLWKRIRMDHLCSQPRPKPEITLKIWQQNLFNLLKGPICPRKVYVIVDEIGGCGKTTFCTWLSHEMPDLTVLRPGKGSDIAHLFVPARVVIFDIPRSTGEAVCWSTIEQIKDGYLVSTKYNSNIKQFPPPHLVIFMNDRMPSGKLSQDRLVEIVIDGDK